MKFEQYRDELVQQTVKSIRIPSVKETAAGQGKPFGEPIAQALEEFLALGEKLGFKTENFSGYAGHVEFGDGPEILGVLCHLDVVPAGQGWTVDPFGGEIKDGNLYGRGTIDNKGPALASLYAMAALKDSGWVPRRKVRLIVGADEESGWGCMKHYMSVAEKPDLGFAPDAEFPVINNEKGIMMLELSGALESPSIVALEGGNRPNMVPDRCSLKLKGVDEELIAKAAVKIGAKMESETEGDEVVVTFKGVSAHGSMPEAGENAISYALAMLNQLGIDQGLVGFLYDNIGFNHDGRGLNVELKDESGPLTANMGVIETENSTIKVILDIRYPISFSQSEIEQRIREILPGDISMQVMGGKAPLHVDANSELVKALQDVYKRQTGQPPNLISIGGGTYARALDNAVAFGPVFPGQEELAHQPDEYISVEHLLKLQAIYADAIKMLAGKGGE